MLPGGQGGAIPRAVSRLPFIDWVRGLAVVAMMVWHTADAWLLPGLRAGEGWSFLRFFGGLAAPSFLFLAGLSAALSVKALPPNLTALEQRAARNRAFFAAMGRGLEVVLLGYLLRFQTWMIDAAEIRKLGQAHVWLPIGIGYGLLVLSVNQLDVRPRRKLARLACGLVLCLLGFVQVEGVAPGRVARLLQVDVLQAIGMSLVMLALLQRWLGALNRPALLVSLGLAVALFTAPLSHVLPGALPGPIAGYLGKWPSPKGIPPAALFPLFPWFAYACVGGAAGTLLRRYRADPGDVLLVLGTLGGAVALATSESHALVANLHALLPWLVAVTRVAYRVGLVLVLMLFGYAWTGTLGGRVLVSYGKASLRVYWVHLLFAYGVLGRLLQKQSGYGQWALWLLPLLAAMWILTKIGRREPRKSVAPLASTAAQAR
jgi:uncharacterized membrane protein